MVTSCLQTMLKFKENIFYENFFIKTFSEFFLIFFVFFVIIIEILLENTSVNTIIYIIMLINNIKKVSVDSLIMTDLMLYAVLHDQKNYSNIIYSDSKF